VVCSYLCQACGLSVEQALESFAAARPPGVKHEKFIRELHVRYGSTTASMATTPESGSLLGASPPAADTLAAEAVWLRQHGSAAIAAAAAAHAAADGGQAPEPDVPAPAAAAAALLVDGAVVSDQQRQVQQQQQQQREEEDQHFEDAAAMVRQASQRSRTLSLRGSGGGESLKPAGNTSPCSGGGSFNRDHSGHSGLAEAAAAMELDAAASSEAAEDADAWVATTAGVGFDASRKLRMRNPSRGAAANGGNGGGNGGGLSQALAGSSSALHDGSPDSSASFAVGGEAILANGLRTGTSSMSDFAAAAAHLEGHSSMRRSTSLVLARCGAQSLGLGLVTAGGSICMCCQLLL
jgi:putative NADH-flavin reductase